MVKAYFLAVALALVTVLVYRFLVPGLVSTNSSLLCLVGIILAVAYPALVYIAIKRLVTSISKSLKKDMEV
ncbi:hypothetical protein [Chimaeribacter californicus]|uniref:hypothetical protein n=1 Tax=Chimaeribacter californicus TaxID=2060067 RepID=UPI0011AF63F4|nr:hypothetical protein [Chimaeribacter californicus]